MKFIRLLSPLYLLAAATGLHAEVKVSKVFTPHMVLQRGMAVPIWGTAAPGEQVTVKFAGQTQTAKADDKGGWKVALQPLKANADAQVLTIGDKQIEDVLVGDVWIGSGQSNMDMPVASYIANDPVLAAAAGQTYPLIRLMRKEPNAVWEQATPVSIPKFSALLFSFGFPLQKAIDVPLGLMVGAVGGTPSGYWLSEDMYRSDTACAEVVKKAAATYKYDDLMAKYNVDKAKYDQDLAIWKPLADAAKKEGKQPPPAPRGPQAVGKAGEANSGKIGQLFEAFIRPYVGYAIKGVLWDQGESRTNIAAVDQVTLMGALIRGWRRDWGQGEFPFLYVEKPSGGGCAYDYANPMNRLADKFAPLPKTQPPGPALDYSHEVFSQLMKYPNTHMVTSSDLGSGIHPPNKSGYGARAVQVALSTAYGAKSEYLGPRYQSFSLFGGDKIVLKFTHTGQGLTYKNGDKLQGFAIAGEDKKFAWAEATVEGNTLILTSKEVPHPVAARYAWSNTFPWANLFNKDGFPAQPFRTDEW